MKLIAKNKKAFFDYDIGDTLEAGLVLSGDEVKSLRAGQVSLVGAFAVFRGGELFLVNCNITTYAQAYTKKDDLMTRSRKLLLHKKELNRLIGDISKKGITIVPLSLYFNKRSKVKVELGIARHKKAASKKQAIKERDIDRQAQRDIKDSYRE